MEKYGNLTKLSFFRNRLNEIIAYPSTQLLSSDDRDLIWQYR